MPRPSSSDVKRFDIPNSDEDLLLDHVGFYYVRDGDMEVEQIRTHLDDFGEQLDEDNYMSIVDHFDALFSIAKYNSMITDWSLRLRAVDVLLNCQRRLMTPISNCITKVLKHEGLPTNEVLEDCGRLSDCLLMFVYLNFRLCSHFETEIIRRERAAGAKKSRKGAELDEEMSRWVVLRRRVVAAFVQICELSVPDKDGKIRKGAIKYLWRPADPDKGMIKCFIDTVFKFLEHPDNVRVANRVWLIEVFKLIRQICIKFDYFHRLAGALVEKTIHLDFMKEATLTTYPFIEGIKGAAVDGDMDPLLAHMVHYLGNLGEVDFSKTSPKPYALFLQTMAEKAPKILIKHLSGIVGYLENDPSQLRSAVLSAFADMICSDVLSDENCQQYSRLNNARQRMFERLMDHLIDQNAQTRSKVVHLWAKLAERQKIPPSVLKQSIITKIGKRLLDKSVNVRKAAVHFMSTFLMNNPYGHDFSYGIHIKELNVLLKRREVLEKKNPEYQGVEGADKLFDEHSLEIQTKLIFWLEKFRTEPDTPLEPLGNATPEDVYSASISQLIQSPDQAAQLIIQLIYTKMINVITLEGDWESEEISSKLISELKTSYVQYKVAAQMQDDLALIESEERVEDYTRKLQKVEQNIEWLQNKLIVELEIEECVPIALRAVIHGELAEMKEGIKFVVECKHFMIRGADKAVRSLCSLIWRRNTDIRKEVLEAAQRMFISTNKDKQIQQTSTANNLMDVVQGMKEEERGCVEEVICLMAAGNIPDGVLDKVWNAFNKHQGKKKLVPLRLLTILARADKGELRKRLRSFQRIIRDGEMDMEIRAEALAAIANLSSERQSQNEEVFRVPCKDSLFATIERFALNELLNVNSTQWFTVFQNTLSIYFDLAKDTCLVVGRLVSKATWYLRRVTEWLIYYESQLENEKDEAKIPFITHCRNFWKDIWLAGSERLLALCGELALRSAIHADVTYFREAKRLPVIIQAVKRKELQAVPAENRPLKDWEYRSAMRKGIFDYSEKDEHNPQGTSDEERVKMRSDAILRTRLFKQGRIFSRLLPFIMYCLRAQSSPAAIRNAAALAFSKFMLASNDLSERGANLFFSLLNNSEFPSLRSNLMLAAGDLCFRAPNMVERYASDVYSMTKDKSACVRETSILVLTHLTTNQMLKMRGSLADVARCYCDESPSVRALTTEFFQELANRGSYVYNLMPDFISRLSRNSRDCSLGKFKTIMEFLIGLLKDKFADALVEKLSHRFEHAKGEGSKYNKQLQYYYSYCISQFQLSDKSLYKVRDAWNCYAPFLEDKQIYEDFLNCVQPLIKTTKSIDVKNDAEDFEKMLTDAHEKGIRKMDSSTLSRSKTRPTRGAPRGRGRGPRGRRPRQATILEESDESD